MNELKINMIINFIFYYRIKQILKICLLGFGFALLSGYLKAQAPSCTNSTVMYGMFNDTSGTNRSAIYPITFANGNIGPRMGGTSFTILSPTHNVPGSASLAVDPYSQRFYYMTSMNSNNPEPKDIYSYDPVTATRVKIGTTPSTGPNSLNDYHFVKMAFHPNGYIYALGVHRRSNASNNQQVLIRFTTCGATPVTDCSTIEIMGYINSSVLNQNMFNGDIAFDYSGNMWIAVNDRTTPPGNQSYMYAIRAVDMPTTPGTGLINVTFMYDLDGLDGLSVNGVAFDAAGNLYTSALRIVPGTGRVSELYYITGNNTVIKVNTFGVIPTSSIITDLAACVLPLYVLNDNGLKLSTSVINKTAKLTWTMPTHTTSSSFEIQRKPVGSTTFTVIGTTHPGDATSIYFDNQTTPGAVYEYRIKEIVSDNTFRFSNICRVKIISNTPDFKIFPNPATNRIQVISYNYYSQLPLQFQLFDITGKLVWKGSADTTPNNIYEIRGLENIQRGTYVLEIIVPDIKQSFHKKVILR